MKCRKQLVLTGYWVAEESFRIAHSAQHAADIIGGDRKLVNSWSEGNAPSVIYLQRLHEPGADVLYILTVRRCANAAA